MVPSGFEGMLSKVQNEKKEMSEEYSLILIVKYICCLSKLMILGFQGMSCMGVGTGTESTIKPLHPHLFFLY